MQLWVLWEENNQGKFNKMRVCECEIMEKVNKKKWMNGMIHSALNSPRTCSNYIIIGSLHCSDVVWDTLCSIANVIGVAARAVSADTSYGPKNKLLHSHAKQFSTHNTIANTKWHRIAIISVEQQAEVEEADRISMIMG